MRGVRRFRGIWRDASFSLKFAAVILVAGAAIAVVPLMLAEASARTQAESGAADRVSIAASLVDGQRASLAVFIAGVGRQLAANHDASAPSAVEATLAEDGAVIGTDDVLGVVRTDGAIIAVHGTTPTASALINGIVSAATAGITTAAAPDGRAWLVAASQIPRLRSWLDPWAPPSSTPWRTTSGPPRIRSASSSSALTGRARRRAVLDR
jgi:hypothetical protein